MRKKGTQNILDIVVYNFSLSLSFSFYYVITDDLPDDRNCECCVQCCFHYESWLSFQYCLYQIVRDPLFELFITLCIVLNTTFLALEHHGMSETVRSVLDIGNKVMMMIDFRMLCPSPKKLFIDLNFFPFHPPSLVFHFRFHR